MEEYTVYLCEQVGGDASTHSTPKPNKRVRNCKMMDHPILQTKHSSNLLANWEIVASCWPIVVVRCWPDQKYIRQTRIMLRMDIKVMKSQMHSLYSSETQFRVTACMIQQW